MSHRFAVRALIHGATIALLAVGAGRASAAPVEYGVRMGLNVSRFPGTFDDAVGFDSRPAITGGACAAIALSPVLSLEVGGFYSQKGAKTQLTLTDYAGNPIGPQELVYAFDYFEVPVLVRVRPAASLAWSPEFRVGPTFGFKLSSRVMNTSGMMPTFELDNVKAFDPGIQAGVGLVLGSSPLRVSVGAAFTQGLVDALDQKSPDLNGRNRVFTFTLGVVY
jgi:hypothetical protein